MIVAFQVLGDPHSKGRPRFGKGRTYTDKADVAYERAVGFLARAAMHGVPPFAGPVALTVVAVHARPQRRPECVPVDAWKQGARVAAVTVGDIDNKIKAASDAMNGIVYYDDRQVVAIQAWSLFAASGESPRVEVRVESVYP